MTKFLAYFVGACVLLLGALYFLSLRPEPERITYGVTFSVPYAEEIGIDWKAAYRAMLSDLGVKHLRLVAYWNETEPERDVYDWRDLDFQISEAKKHDADVILSVGRRLPRWPECHVPRWVGDMPWEERQMEIKQLITAVIERYKDNPTIIMWQIENEPYLTAFATEHCGWLDEDFLQEEIALARSLDSRPVLVTDGGNFGLWYGAYTSGDVFGTSMYLYFWRPEVGAFRTVLPAVYYRIKSNVVQRLFGEKPMILSELSLEPWLAAHIEDVPVDEQVSRMPVERMREIVAYAKETGFDTQYVWGVEWWYWMKTKQNRSEFWDEAKGLF